ncbi:DEAD/DEAH box helicase [Jiella pacifica]|uniref:Transcription-repair-coupling factor n=1 Tax=Jiella pacifica TaxID=2696469 RepID=A0A6N9T506_9HYPH|nr:DEAD/DEAH box helicase [Jiella pacifica]NDW05662.1 DEAD/DEAH box helicase [Jiella pacifica]
MNDAPAAGFAAEDRLFAALEPLGAIAADLLQLIEEAARAPLFYVARDAGRARALEALLRALAPRLAIASLPAWDCPAYDRASPSRASMGQRMAVLRWLTDPASRPALVVMTPDALLRRVPPPQIWRKAHLAFRVGETVVPEAAEAALRRIGYVLDERVDEPGEAALRGRVIEIFPAAAAFPCRIEHEDGRITAIHSYDPATQRSIVEIECLDVDPASEIVLSDQADAADLPEGTDLPSGREHWLPLFYPELASVFDYAGDARLVCEAGAGERGTDFLDGVRDGHESEMAFRRGAGNRWPPAAPDHVFLRQADWDAALAARTIATVGASSTAAAPADDRGVPRFCTGRNAERAFRRFVEDRLTAGGRIVLAGPKPGLDSFRRRAERLLGQASRPVADWREATASDPGSLLSLALPLDHGFQTAGGDVAVIAAADLLGSRAKVSRPEVAMHRDAAAGPMFRIGEPVIHRDHGLGLLEGIEEIALPEGATHDALRLRYEGGATLMVPVTEIEALWSYGGDAGAVTLDRLKGERWAKRRARLDEAIRTTAEKLVEAVRERHARKAPKLVPETVRFERFAARFAHVLTPGQADAIDAVLADLSSGRRMDRLICADVGYGKTEVALRAAAATVFAGKQVAFVAPTTVLVRQHLRTLIRRFAGTGIAVAELSRMVKPADARAVKEGLKSGAVRIVVGTHAVAAKDVGFADLGLVVLDEEQHFGARVKSRLKSLAETAHVLTLTATPIPRTLQASLVGLQDLSVIETPPVARQSVRTAVAAFDEAAVQSALRREKLRGGQSFVVCPRIEDLAPMAERLRALAPELELVTAHGEMCAGDIDAVMLGFADGEGDVLLATNIIESGLDVPNANTMIVWHADYFGLAQLHQLRGRVGRGARRGTVLLLTDPEQAVGEEAQQRLSAIEKLHQIGAGFDISGRDLDLRGAGDLLGEEQAGHIRLIGISLYRHLLDRAVKAAEGAALEDEWRPAIRLGISGRIPASYIPEDEARIDLYARFAAADNAQSLAELEDEVADRFGPLPPEMANLLALAEIRLRCQRADIAELDGGRQAIAAGFRPARFKTMKRANPPPGLEWSGGRLLLREGSTDARERLGLANDLLDALEGAD